MSKAWLSVELEDYERHVELDHVGQAPAIRGCIASAIQQWQPDSLLYLGCAGGNGLEAASGIASVVAIDFNQLYLNQAAIRHPEINFLCWDLNDGAPHVPPVDLIFGALVLEYVANLEALLRGLTTRLNRHGKLMVLLLGVRNDAPAVLPSPYRAALAGVGAEYRAIAKGDFLDMASAAGWALQSEREIELPSGKYFSELVLTPVPARHRVLDIHA